MRKSIIFIISLIIVSFAIGIYLHPQMPDMMASHWNAEGKVDGYMPKTIALFLMPSVSVILFIMFIFIPKLDPLKENIQKFMQYYEWFIVLMVAFFFYLYLLSIFVNLGYSFNMLQALIPAFAVLFYYIGVLCENSKRNWFIGIRTPWTLSSDEVWDKTHKLGGKLFKISGIIALLSVFVSDYSVWLIVGPVVVSAVITIVYSYLEYQKQVKGKSDSISS